MATQDEAPTWLKVLAVALLLIAYIGSAPPYIDFKQFSGPWSPPPVFIKERLARERIECGYAMVMNDAGPPGRKEGDREYLLACTDGWDARWDARLVSPSRTRISNTTPLPAAIPPPKI